MKNTAVTIIVPVYNVEAYLEKCVESLMQQTFKNFDVVLVNDGSTDASGILCDTLARQHSQIKVVHKENGGLSDARNKGYGYITGEYVMFLDSDDYLSPNALELLYGFATENKCDVVQGGFYYAYPDYLLYDNRWYQPNSQPFILTREEAMAELIKNNYVKNFAWGKLYNSEIVKQFEFPKGKFYEDSFWQHLVIDKVSSFGVVPYPIVYYTQRNDSISGAFNKKSIDLLQGLEQRFLFIQKNYPALVTDMRKVLLKTIRLHYSRAKKNSEPGIREIFEVYLSEAADRIKISPFEKFWIKSSTLQEISSLPKRIFLRVFGKKAIIIKR